MRESEREQEREGERERKRKRERLSLFLSLLRALSLTFSHFLPKFSTFSDPGSQDRAISATLAPPKRLNTTVQAPKLMFEVTKRSSGVTIHCASKRLTKLCCYENNHAQLKTTSSGANFWTWTSLWRWTLPLNCCSWVAAEQAEHFRNRRCT